MGTSVSPCPLAASVGLEAHGRIWDLRQGKCVMTLVGHVKQCLSVDFSPNGYQCVTGSDDHTAGAYTRPLFSST